MYSSLPAPVAGRAKPHSSPPAVSLVEIVSRWKVIPVPAWVNVSWANAAGIAIPVSHCSVRTWVDCGLTKSGQQRSCLESGKALHLQMLAPQKQYTLDGIPRGKRAVNGYWPDPCPSTSPVIYILLLPRTRRSALGVESISRATKRDSLRGGSLHLSRNQDRHPSVPLPGYSKVKDRLSKGGQAIRWDITWHSERGV